MLPAPEPVVIEMAASSVTASEKLMLLLVVVIEPARLTLPVPFCVKPPSATMLLPASVKKFPVLVTVTVLSLSSKVPMVNAVPLKLNRSVSVTSSSNVVVLPAVCSNFSAATVCMARV